MTIDELIAEGKKLQSTNIKTRSNSTKYHTWTNNCMTYLEQIKFSKDRRNQFMFYAANSKFEPMLGMLQSIKDNSESEGPVTNCDRFESLKHSSSAPYAFTEQGISMLLAVVTSQKAVNTRGAKVPGIIAPIYPILKYEEEGNQNMYVGH